MDAGEFVENFLAHRGKYDPVKAHEYYLRTRNLNPRKKIQEDEIPETSPSGAKVIDFDPKNGGRATYSDGSTFDGDGWNKSGHNTSQRVQAAQEKLMAAKTAAKKIKDPKLRKAREARLSMLQKQLDGVKAKHPEVTAFEKHKLKTLGTPPTFGAPAPKKVTPPSAKKPVLKRASSKRNSE